MIRCLTCALFYVIIALQIRDGRTGLYCKTYFFKRNLLLVSTVTKSIF
nr:MAG TPA: hypothetical protein [Caudoviricetes sp.]